MEERESEDREREGVVGLGFLEYIFRIGFYCQLKPQTGGENDFSCGESATPMVLLVPMVKIVFTKIFYIVQFMSL